ncbi:nucleotide cyclase [Chytridium lagenaria]|nr:nucleotide cyclase [Chytridium lagenaria]
MYILEQRLRINFITKKRLEIETRRLQERQKSVEAILELVLPKDVITRMQIQNYSFSIVDRFESAFCVFVDFFSAQKLDLIEPYACIKALNATFMSLDLLLQEYPTIEKIKTISSKGLLISTPSGPDEMIVYSDAVTSFCFELFRKLNGDSFNELPELLKRSVTIGVAFGEIVAGLVGERRFCYDVYGDIVNTASRMQTLGLLHPILCTEDTFSQFSSTTQMKWRSCGIHSVKGKGDMLIYRAASEADDKKEATGNLADSLSRLGVDSRSKEDRKPSYIDVGDDAIRSILISFKKQHEPISPVSPSERHANLGNIKAIPSQDRAQRLVERRVTLQKLQKLSVSGNDTSFPDTSKLQPFSLTDIGRNQKTLKMREVENPKKRSIPILDYFIEYSNHWNHIDRFSLKFFELKNREEYRNGVRQNVKSTTDCFSRRLLRNCDICQLHFNGNYLRHLHRP